MSNRLKERGSNLKIGLIFVRNKVFDQDCVANVGKTDAVPPCKKHDKWIVVAGNLASYNINAEVSYIPWPIYLSTVNIFTNMKNNVHVLTV